MTRLITVACVFVLLASAASAQTPAAQSHSPPASAQQSALTPDEARRALDTLQNDAKRKQVIETLRAIAAAAPKPEPQTPAASPSTEPAQAAPEKKSEVQLSADSLGAQLLVQISEQAGEWSREIAQGARSVTHFPLLWRWLVQTATDPWTWNLLLDIAWKLALILGLALGAEWLLMRALRRPRAALRASMPHAAREPARAVAIAGTPALADGAATPELKRRQFSLTRAWQSLLRLPFVIGKLFLDLLPVAAFAAVGTALAGTGLIQYTTTRLAILAIVNAYAISRGLLCLARMIVSSGPLSLVTVGAETSAYIGIWMRRIVYVGVFGVALANVALLFGLYRPGYFALLRLVMLAVHLFAVVIILQCRGAVARAIRADRTAHGAFAGLRNRVAGLWHVGAIALVMALWAVWALNVRNGYALLLQYFAGTVAVVVISRLVTIVALGIIDRVFRIQPDLLERFPLLEARANRYLPLLRRIVSTIIGVVAAVALLEVWGVDAVVWFYGGQIGGRLLSAIITVGIAATCAVVIWEICNALMDRQLARLNREGHFARAARLRTFQPMLRTTLLCAIAAVVGLTALSEIGVNVAPLLAGAGIIGIAIGFGSQKLVQDLITGLFLLLENVVQVGDAVTVSGLSGVVENVSIRTIRLRAGDGAVHIVPFSAVTTVTNASRGVGNAAVNVSIAYKEDTDRASEVLKEIAAGMREEPEFRNLIRDDLQLWGVDKVDGAIATIVGQIPCSDAGRWPVQREFNRRLKRRFQERGIEIAPSTQTIIVHAAPPPEPEADDHHDGRSEREPQRPRRAARG